MCDDSKEGTHSSSDVNTLLNTMNIDVVMMASSRIRVLAASMGYFDGILATNAWAIEKVLITLMGKRIGVTKTLTIVVLLEAKLLESMIKSIRNNCEVVVAKTGGCEGIEVAIANMSLMMHAR